MPNMPETPGLRPASTSSFPGPDRGVQQRRSRLWTASISFIAPADLVEFQMNAPSGGSGSNAAANKGGGGSGAGQSAFGVLRLVKGKRYTLTMGAVGAAGASGFGTNDGTDAGDTTLVGPGVNITCIGGKKGLGAGTGGAAAGANATSELGYKLVAGGKGGDGQTSAVGLAGDGADTIPGGAPGAGSPSGGGGGSSMWARGGTGGSSTAAGNQSALADLGAGSGGSGAGDGSNGPGGAAGRKGFLRIWWWQ